MSELPPSPSTFGRLRPSLLMTFPVTTEFAMTKPLATPKMMLICRPCVIGSHGFWQAPWVGVTCDTYRLPRMFTRRSVAVCDVYQSIPPAGTPLWIGLMVRFDIWLGRIARLPLLMLNAPLMTTSQGPEPRPATTVPLATWAWITLLVVAVDGVTVGSP